MHASPEWCSAIARLRWGEKPSTDADKFEKLADAFDKGSLRHGDLTYRDTSGAAASSSAWCHANTYNVFGLIRQAVQEIGKGGLNQQGAHKHKTHVFR